MPSRLYEGMISTQSHPRGGSRGKASLLALLAGILVLAPGWVMFSTTGGQVGREAQAQTPAAGGGGSGELAQSATASGDGAEASAGADGAQAYAAYKYKDPFDQSRVAQVAQEGDQSNDVSEPEPDNTNAEEDGARAQNQTPEAPQTDDNVNNNAGANGANDSGTDNGDQTSEGTIPSGETPGSGTENVDCESLQGLAKVICEDEQGSAGSTAADGENGTEPGGQQGDPGSGGSGRSGAGGPTETFRNGGGGASK